MKSSPPVELHSQKRGDRSSSATPESIPWGALRRWEPALVVLLLLISLAFRVYRLEYAPPGLQHDEAFNAHDAELVLGGARPIFFEANYGREAFFIYLMAGFIRVLGRSTLAVRLTGVSCGLVGQVLIYLLMRQMFGRRVALLTLALSTISFWHLFDSRLGLRAISLPMIQTLSLYLLWLGLARRRRIYWILSGAALGLTLYTYLSARVAPLVPFAFVLYLAMVRQASLKGQWVSVGLSFVVALMVFAPFGAYMLLHPEAANARLRVLSGTLGQILSGNLDVMLRSLLATLGMFTFKGDMKWRYNLAGLPVFDPVTGLFFYGGLFLCLRRWRDPRGMLLVLWMVIMLLPSALTDSAPSFLRSVGALPPILAMPAVGLVALWDGLRRKGWRRVELAMLPILVGGWMILGAITYRNYFLVWARAPEPRAIYEADIAEAARYLNALTDRPLVCISSDFALDLDRYALITQLHKDYHIKWFDGRQAFMLPAPSGDTSVVYIFTASAPLSPQMAERYFAGLLPVYQPLDPQGVPIITVYRLSPQDLAERRSMPPPQPLAACLGGDVDLMGYDLPEGIAQGETIRVTVYWRPRRFSRDFSEAPIFFLHLRDDQGHLWAQSDRIGYAAWDWEDGDLAVNWFELATTGDFPPQSYWVHVGMTSAGRKLPVIGEDGRALGYDLRLQQPTRLTRKPLLVAESSLPIGMRASVNFEGEVALRGYSLPTEARPGERLTLALFWQALTRPRSDYRVSIRFIDGKGQLQCEKTEGIWPGTYPSSQWYPGGFVRSYHEIALPATLPSEELLIQIGLVDEQGRELAAENGAKTVGKLKIKGRARVMTIPKDIQYPLRAELGDVVSFLGYSLVSQSVSPGGTLGLTLYWQARQAMSTSYTVFVHVLAPDNSIVGQKDNPPNNGDSPTSGWIAGEVISDPYEVPIKPDIPDGEYLIEVGMYDPVSLERLPVSLDGKPDPDRRIVLGKILIRE